MSSLCESPMFDTTFEDGREWTIHTRNLGTKQGHIYPTIQWSDVVINETYFDDTLDLENKGEFLNLQIESANEKEQGENIVNQKIMNNIIHESSSEYSESSYQRKIPARYLRQQISKKNKKPTKPITDFQPEMRKKIEEKFNSIIH